MPAGTRRDRIKDWLSKVNAELRQVRDEGEAAEQTAIATGSDPERAKAEASQQALAQLEMHLKSAAQQFAAAIQRLDYDERDAKAIAAREAEKQAEDETRRKQLTDEITRLNQELANREARLTANVAALRVAGGGPNP